MKITENEVANEPTRATGARQRRARLALADLGLLTIVGGDWLGLTDAGAARFAELDATAVDRLLRRLEELVELVPECHPIPGAGQLTFDVDAVDGPVPVFREADGHLRVAAWG